MQIWVGARGRLLAARRDPAIPSRPVSAHTFHARADTITSMGGHRSVRRVAKYPALNRLRPARLGPTVGHVAHEAARIWIRTNDPEDAVVESACDRRILGVVAIRQAGAGREFSGSRTGAARLQREYDPTGTFTFSRNRHLGSDRRLPPLAPGTRYDVPVGTLSVDDPCPQSVPIADTDLVPPFGLALEGQTGGQDLRADPGRSARPSRSFPTAWY